MTRKCKQCKKHIKNASKCTDIIEKKGFCSIECLVLNQREKLAKKKLKDAKNELRRDKERVKPLSTLCSEAQSDVNAMIRAVDNALSYKCIATGRDIEHAGHYVHAGSKYRISWLRFYHANIHGQHGESNTHKSGDTVNYRQGLVDRYGETYIKELEDFKRCEDSGLWPKPCREDISAMRKWCRDMTKIYKKMDKFKTKLH